MAATLRRGNGHDVETEPSPRLSEAPIQRQDGDIRYSAPGGESARQMDGIQRPYGLDRERALGAVQDLVVGGNAVPVRAGAGQQPPAVREFRLGDVFERPGSDEGAFALEERDSGREYSLGTGQVMTGRLSSVFAEEPR